MKIEMNDDYQDHIDLTNQSMEQFISNPSLPIDQSRDWNKYNDEYNTTNNNRGYQNKAKFNTRNKDHS